MAHIDPPVPDLVAFSGHRVFTTLASGFTRAELTQAIADALTEVGWDIISGPTVQTHGNGYFFRSQQSPWYDHDNIPAWYLGNKCVLELNNQESSTQIRFRVGVDYNGTTEHMMTAAVRFELQLAEIAGFDFYIHANPYQMMYWSANVDGSGSGSQDGDQQFRSLIVSAINLPKNMLQLHRIIHCVMATTRVRGLNTELGGGATGRDYVCFRVKDDAGNFSQNSLGDDGLRFFTPHSGFSRGHRTGRRIWNRSLDVTMTDENQWSAFFCPPYACFKLPDELETTINGFLWDCLVITEGFHLNTVIEQTDRNWAVFGALNLTSPTGAGSALFVCIDEIEPEV